jgi:Ca2+/Na+ antiporter
LQLVVVVASVVRNRSSLALGNVIGAAISNILGAFSLGLLFHSTKDGIEFDRSSKVYSLLLLLLTAFVTALTLVGTKATWRIFGGILLAIFVIYITSIAWAITRGAIKAPELSDSDSESDDDGSSQGSASERGERNRAIGVETRIQSNHVIDDSSPQVQSDSRSENVSRSPTRARRRVRRSLKYHISFLLLGFLSICLSGYVLSHSSTTLSDEIGTSDVLFGVVILSIATTLPEKFIAVLSGSRGHTGILVANTVGSNIFLLSLCLGIVWVVTAGNFDAGSVNAAEMGVLMGSTVAVTATVWFGAKWARWIGGAMLVAYVAFLVLEFTVIRKV